MKLKLFEEFISESNIADYPVGEYDYSYIDKDFKPLGQPLKLKVVAVAAPAVYHKYISVELIVHNQSLELYPIDDPSTNTHPGVFSHPSFKEAATNGNPNPWPAGTAYIKIYKKGEKPQIG
jgi:hypothetical protein